jgi:hypothetical protein
MARFNPSERREPVFAVVKRNLQSQGLESYRVRPSRMPVQRHLEKRGFAFCGLAGLELQSSSHGLYNYECSPARPLRSRTPSMEWPMCRRRSFTANSGRPSMRSDCGGLFIFSPSAAAECVPVANHYDSQQARLPLSLRACCGESATPRSGVNPGGMQPTYSVSAAVLVRER